MLYTSKYFFCEAASPVPALRWIHDVALVAEQEKFSQVAENTEQREYVNCNFWCGTVMRRIVHGVR